MGKTALVLRNHGYREVTVMSGGVLSSPECLVQWDNVVNLLDTLVSEQLNIQCSNVVVFYNAMGAM